MPEITEPVENPGLVAALDRLAADPSAENRAALLDQVRTATYLAGAFMDGMRLTPDAGGGTATVGPGSTLRFVSAERDGSRYLLLFTDWRAVRAYTDAEVTGYVLPAADAWAFALAGFDAVVINPAHNALPLDRGVLEYLRDN